MTLPTPTRRIQSHGIRLALLAMGALLGACETTPEVTPVADPERAWVEHQDRLADLRQWTAIGKLGVQSEQDSWSAGIQWHQDRDDYRIRLSGPLGQRLMELRGTPGLVEMRTSDDVFRAASPEALLETHAGWRVPLTGLRYWIQGRPDPQAPIEALELDPGGRLAELRQLGWAVHIERYAEFDGIALPTKLTLENARARAKLVVRTWRTGPAST